MAEEVPVPESNAMWEKFRSLFEGDGDAVRQGIELLISLEESENTELLGFINAELSADRRSLFFMGKPISDSHYLPLHLWSAMIQAGKRRPAEVQELDLPCPSSEDYPAVMESLATLSQLRYLKLNAIGRSSWRRMHRFPVFPNEIGRLKNLEELYLECHDFTELPGWIVELTKLRKLSIAETRVKRLPYGFARLPCLEMLNLNGSGIGLIPRDISSMPSLKRIYLRRVVLQGIPKGCETHMDVSVAGNEVRTSEPFRLSRYHGNHLLIEGAKRSL